MRAAAMAFARRTLLEWALLALALAAFAGLAAWQGWFWRLDRSAYDVAANLQVRAVPDDVLIVAIDEESLARIGRWPWRRAVHATLLQRLTHAGVRAVALDLVLTEPSADDAVLAAAMRRNGRVVLPVVQQDFGPGLHAEGLPVAPLARAAAGLGHIGLELDADGIVRSVYLWAGMGAPRYPQLALALLAVARQAVPGQVVPGQAVRQAGSADAGVDEPGARAGMGPGGGLWRQGGRFYLRFAGPPGSYHSVSYVDVLTGAVPDEVLRGKLVLVGASAAGLGDAYPRPASGRARLMPGVEWHATVLDNLRTHAAIVPVSRSVVTALTALVAVAALLGQLLLSPRGGLLLALALAIGVPLGAAVLLLWGGLWLPPAPMLLGVVLAYPLWAWRRLEAAQRFMDAELQALRAEVPAATAVSAADTPRGPLEARLAILRAATAQRRIDRQTREERLHFISHDLRAPLAAIVTLTEGAYHPASLHHASQDGAAGQAADARLPAEPYHALQRAGRYAHSALALADDLVRLGRAEAADPRRFARVELAALADEATDEMWVQATARRITLATHYEGLEDAAVLGDRALLRRALANLLGNAIAHGPPGSTVSVAVHHADADGFFRIAVTDQGAGIAPERLPDLFTRYHRGDAGHAPDGSKGLDESRGAGIGLGLLIVKTIVERHGGTVAVRSEPGVGSCFSMRLPAYQEPDRP